MRYVYCCLIVSLMVLGCGTRKTTEEKTPVVEKNIVPIDSTLVTDTSWGTLNANDEINSIKAKFGASNIKDERICGAECMDSVDVTYVNQGTDKEFVIYWMDSAYHKKIAFIRNYTNGSPYHTLSGIKVGSKLSDLLRINGKKIVFSGFGWDYGGAVQSYSGGTLDSSAIGFNLDLPDGTNEKLFGDSEFNTDMPEVKKAIDKIIVSEMSFNPRRNEE